MFSVDLQFIYFAPSVHSGQTDSASSTSGQAQPHPGSQSQTVHVAAAPKQAKVQAPTPQTPVTLVSPKKTDI